MKKLRKLSINPEKVIKNEELINLRGGYGEYGGYDNEDPTYTCTADNLQGQTHEFTSSNADLLNSWCNFWSAAPDT